MRSRSSSYAISASLKNIGARRIDDWQIELEFPTAFLDGVLHGLKVDDRSTSSPTLAKPFRELQEF